MFWILSVSNGNEDFSYNLCGLEYEINGKTSSEHPLTRWSVCKCLNVMFICSTYVQAHLVNYSVHGIMCYYCVEKNPSGNKAVYCVGWHCWCRYRTVNTQCFDQIQAIEMSSSGWFGFEIGRVFAFKGCVNIHFQIYKCCESIVFYFMHLQIGQLAYPYHFESDLKIRPV